MSEELEFSSLPTPSVVQKPAAPAAPWDLVKNSESAF